MINIRPHTLTFPHSVGLYQATTPSVFSFTIVLEPRVLSDIAKTPGVVANANDAVRSGTMGLDVRHRTTVSEETVVAFQLLISTKLNGTSTAPFVPRMRKVP